MKKHIAKLFIIAISLSVFSFGCKKIKVPVATFNDNVNLPIHTAIQIGHTLKENKVAFSPDGKYLVSGGEDCSVVLWHVKSGKIMKYFHGHKGPIQSVIYSPDGKYVASNSRDCSVRIWDVETGKCVLVKDKLGYKSGWQYIQNEKVVYKGTNLISDNLAIAFSSCGKHLAVSRLKNIDIYDIKNKKIISSLKVTMRLSQVLPLPRMESFWSLEVMIKVLKYGTF